jgi:hypothetical protein
MRGGPIPKSPGIYNTRIGTEQEPTATPTRNTKHMNDTEYDPTIWNLFLYMQPKCLMAESTFLSSCTAKDSSCGMEQSLWSGQLNKQVGLRFCLTRMPGSCHSYGFEASYQSAAPAHLKSGIITDQNVCATLAHNFPYASLS